MRQPDHNATMRQLWRLNQEGRLQLAGPPQPPLTVGQADAAIKLALMDGVQALTDHSEQARSEHAGRQ